MNTAGIESKGNLGSETAPDESKTRRAEPSGSAGAPAAAVAPVDGLTLGRWLAAVAVAMLFLGAAALGVRYVELVTGRYISAGVPPIPAMAALLILTPLSSALRRLNDPWRRLAMDRRQVLIVFSMVSLGTIINGQYVVRAFLPHLGILRYWPSRNNSALQRWVEYFPAWYAPTDLEAWRTYFEGTRGAPPPYHLWLLPIGRWLLFFVAVFMVAGCLVQIIRRQWVQHERLSFPLLYLPLTYTAENASFGGIPLFRHPLFYGGIGLAVAYNAINIAHALNPSIPNPGFSFAFRGMFPDAPWTPFNTFTLFFMIEAIGLGYFVPLEVSFSSWFFYLALKFLAVAGLSAGVDATGFPFMQDQCAGAYLGMTGFILYTARRHLASVGRRALGLAAGAPTPEEREETHAVWGLAGGAIFLLGWCWAAGFALQIAVPFFGVLLCFVLVYARIRAETGVPFGFTYPYGLPKEMVVNAFTARGILDLGGPRSWVAFSGFAWLSRHHFAQEAAAYTIDGLKLADETRTERGWFFAALLVTVVMGVALAIWTHLDAFYYIGSNLVGSGGGSGEYRAQVALQEFQRMATLATSGTPRDLNKLAAQVGGLLFALLLAVLRTLWVRSPFHPLGYILATAYGDHTTIFFPMFAAWLCKSVVLKVGGLNLYRRLVPLFLGIVIGHYAVGGLFWPIFSLLIAPEASRSYHIYFGG